MDLKGLDKVPDIDFLLPGVTKVERGPIPEELREFAEYKRANPLNSQPPLFFEEHTGMKNIAGHYQFPTEEGWGRDDIENMVNVIARPAAYTRPEAMELLTEAWDRLRALNPQLEQLKFDRNDQEKLLDVISGISSDFNIDDMNFFIGADFFAARMHSPEARKKREMEDELIEKYGLTATIEWVPAPSTVESIHRQLADLPQPEVQVRKFSLQPKQSPEGPGNPA